MRVPPHNIEAEMSVLGAMLLGDRGAVEAVREMLKPEDFYRENHAELFAAMLAVARDGVLDGVTLKDYLTARDRLDAVGGVGYVLQLGEVEFTTANIVYYAKIIRRRATLRGLIGAAQTIAARAYGPWEEETDEEAEKAVAAAEQAVFAVSRSVMAGSGKGPQKASVLSDRFLADLDKRHQAGGGFIGTPTHWVDVDNTLNGLRPGYLYVLAARPSMGKSACAGSLMRNIAHNGGVPVLYSLEMPENDVQMRLVSGEAKINSRKLQRAELSDEEWQRVTNATTRLYDLSYYIDAQPGLTAAQIESRTRRIIAEEGGVDLVIVDYLQIMGTDTRESRNVEVGDCAKALKRMAMRLNVPVMVLSQLSRALERRPDKTPIMSDLRESGDIEQEADGILFLHRPSYFDKNADPVDEGHYDKCEVHIPKNRNGDTGIVNLGFSPHFTRFDSLAEDYFREGH